LGVINAKGSGYAVLVGFVAGDAIVITSFVPVKATRGGKKPLLFELISNFAEA
jgi:hypothetical protein